MRELTPIMMEVMRLRDKNYSYPQIAQMLGKAVSTVHESHMSALNIVGIQIPRAVVDKSSINEFRRLEMHSHAEAVMREYWETYKEARDRGQLKTAVEALNGLRGWSEMVIRLHGTSAPERHVYEINVAQVDEKIAELEGKRSADGSYEV